MYSRPCASATASYVILPSRTLTPRASAGSRATACASPCSAIASTYGSVAFVSASVEVIGTPPGMFATQ